MEKKLNNQTEEDLPREIESERNTAGSMNVKRLGPFSLSRNRYLLLVGLFTLAGVIGGYAYYAFVGCKSGGCAITSSPVLSIIWGGAMGYLLPDFFIKDQKS